MRRGIAHTLNRLVPWLDRQISSVPNTLTLRICALSEDTKIVTTLTVTLALTDSTHSTFDVAESIIKTMKKSDPAIAEIALSFVKDRLYHGEMDVVTAHVDPVYYDNGALAKRDTLKQAYNLSPKTLLKIVDDARASFDQWLKDQEIGKIAKTQSKDRNSTGKQAKHESTDPTIARNDLPSVLNRVARKYDAKPKTGSNASWREFFAPMTEQELIAVRRVMLNSAMTDPTRRDSEYRDRLGKAGLSLDQVDDKLEQWENPPKQTRPQPKTRPTESPKTTAKTGSAKRDSDDEISAEDLKMLKLFKLAKSQGIL